jgi:hypothetical protein
MIDETAYIIKVGWFLLSLMNPRYNYAKNSLKMTIGNVSR